MADQLRELISFLKDDNTEMRKAAAEAVLGLSASDDGTALLLSARVPTHLKRLVSDVPKVAEPAVKALVNISASPAGMTQLLSMSMVSSLMEALRDDDCPFKRVIILLLNNLSQTEEGCNQLMQKSDAGGALMGLHFRRLIQWLVASNVTVSSVRRLPDEVPSDTFEHVASLLQNLTQLREARHIILEPERGILPALLPQLQAASVMRRRGIAATIRNCAFERDEKHVKFMLSPAVDVVTALLLPLSGPDVYSDSEKAGMNPALVPRDGETRIREQDETTRLYLVEALQLLTATKRGREHLRRVRSYSVLKAFHEWLEADADAVSASAPASASSDSAPAGVMVRAREEEEEGKKLSEADEATVAAINAIVQQLFRDDEIKHTSEVTARHAPGVPSQPLPALEDAPTPASPPVPTTGAASAAAPVSAAAVGAGAAAAGAGAAAPQPKPVYEKPKQEMVSLEVAKEITARTLAGPDVSSAELESLVTVLPDWTEDDPELPPAFQPFASSAPLTQAAPAKAAAAPASASNAVLDRVEKAGMGGVE